MNGMITRNTWSGFVHQDCTPLGIRDTMLAKISSEMPLPIPRWVISSPIHISSTRPGGQRDHDQEDLGQREVRDQRHARLLLEAREQEHVADRLSERQTDGQVARVLGDPRLADLALLLELLQRGHDDLQQLQDDRGRDVGHDPEREDRDPPEAAAREQVQQPEDPVAAEVLLDRP